MTAIFFLAGLGSLVCAVAAVLLLRMIEAEERLTSRVASIQQSARPSQQVSRKQSSGLLGLVTSVGSSIAKSGLLSSKTVAELQQTLVVSGFRGSNALGLFIGSKLILLIGMPALAWFGLGNLAISPMMHNFGTMAAAVLGLLGPDFVIKKIRARHLKRLAKGLPDALDMMVICSEAGLGLEPAISRVAGEISHAHPAVAIELFQTASELRIIADRRVALQNMGSRTGLEGLKRLGATLIQSTQYGTPLSHALRTLSAEMRTEMLTQFEERAARLPVLLTVPMIVFILPTVFVVVGGPAMLRVFATLHH